MSTSCSGQAYVRQLRDAASPEEAFAAACAALADPAVLWYGSVLHSTGLRVALARAAADKNADVGRSLVALLRLMSYGTIGDVPGEAGVVSGNVSAADCALASAQLSPDLRRKLRLLSLLTLYARHGGGRTEVPYEEVAAFIGLASDADVEELVVEALSARLLVARLDPMHRRVRVMELLQARDVSPQEVGLLRARLVAWGKECDGQLDLLDRAAEACEASDTRMDDLLKAALRLS